MAVKNRRDNEIETQQDAETIATETCYVVFKYTEADNTEKVFSTLSCPKGTPVSEVLPQIFPIREKGYWIFEGWSMEESDYSDSSLSDSSSVYDSDSDSSSSDSSSSEQEIIIEADTTFWAEYSAATIKIPVNAQGATNLEDIPEFLFCTWGASYPELGVMPLKDGMIYKGAYLFYNNNLGISESIYSEGISVNSDVLGSGTKESGEDFDTPDGCEIRLVFTNEDGRVPISFEGIVNPLLLQIFTPFSEIVRPTEYPQKTTGYWTFIGWDIPSEGVISKPMEFAPKYEPAKISIPIDWKEATNVSGVADSLVCTWGETYPDIPIIPTQEDKLFIGASLVAEYSDESDSSDSSSSVDIVQTHNIEGKGVSVVDSTELGTGTSDIAGKVWDAPANCKIETKWEPEVKVLFSYSEYGESTQKVFATQYYPKNTPVTIIPPSDYPIRSRGYWIFNGWKDLPSTEETFPSTANEVSYTAIFIPAKVDVPINWNGADDIGDAGNYLTCTWTETYPSLPVIPTRDGYYYKKASLYANGSAVVQTHNENGDANTVVNASQLGFGTSDNPDTVFLASNGCAITIEWEDAIILTFAYEDTDGEQKVYTTTNCRAGTQIGNIQKPDGFPTLSTGYWVFEGWDIPSSGTVEEDTTFLAQFSPAQIKIPFSLNGAENWTGGSGLECTWGSTFSSLTTIPQKNGTTFLCSVLFDGLQTIDAIHDAQGTSSKTVSYSVLGSGTTDNASNVFEVNDCYLKFFWANSTDISGDDESDSEPTPEPETEYCQVSFVYTEEDGTIKTYAVKQYEKGTPHTAITVPSGFPKRATGFWIFNGWSYFPASPDDSRELTQNLVSEASFTAASLRIPINWNGATNPTIQYLEAKWGATYPSLQMVPQKSGETFAGAFLKSVAENRIVKRTHFAMNGLGATTIDSHELGTGTAKGMGTVFPISSCEVIVLWQEPITWNTLEDLRDAIGILPSPFADDPSATAAIPNATTTESRPNLTFRDGFKQGYSLPLIDPATGDTNGGANVITRKQVNTLGYIGTQEQFFEQCGGYYTFDQSICDAIGGYPESAILRFYDESLGCLRTVYSLVDNNTWNFLTNGVDGVHWKYIDDNPILSVKVDYSDFIDLSNTLFVETGQPDFYEIPYDGMLQLHALSFCDMHSTLRDDDQYAVAGTSTEQLGDTNYYRLVDENIQGAHYTSFGGITYLDIANKNTDHISSIEIRRDGSLCNVSRAWPLYYKDVVYFSYKLPRYVISQGTFFLNKGDKIRIRGVYTDAPWTQTIGVSTRVFTWNMTDKEVRRFYVCKFANFYKTGWEA